MENAVNAGIQVGVYFYTYARNAEEARDEALQCLSEVEKHKDLLSFPIFLDVEEKYQESIDNLKDAYDFYNENIDDENIKLYAGKDRIA